MRRIFGSVRSRATLGATLVVAVALVAAGAAVLLSLRSNLMEQAGNEAQRTAQNVVAQLAAGKPYDRLDLDDESPVQVVDADGTLVAASDELERISGTATDAVKPQPQSGGTGTGAAPATTMTTPTTTPAAARPVRSARAPSSATARRPSTARAPTTASLRSPWRPATEGG